MVSQQSWRQKHQASSDYSPLGTSGAPPAPAPASPLDLGDRARLVCGSRRGSPPTAARATCRSTRATFFQCLRDLMWMAHSWSPFNSRPHASQGYLRHASTASASQDTALAGSVVGGGGDGGGGRGRWVEGGGGVWGWQGTARGQPDFERDEALTSKSIIATWGRAPHQAQHPQFR